MDLTDITEHVDAYRALSTRIAELKTLAAQHRGIIEEKLGDADSGEIDGKTVLTFKTKKQRRLNQQYLKDHFGPVAELCYEVSEYREMKLL